MSKFWTKTYFWKGIERTLALLGAPGGIGLAQWQEDPVYLTITGVALFLSGGLAIWMVDKDNDGTIDLFQKQKQ